MSSSLGTRLYQATARTFEDLGFMLPASDLTAEQRDARCEAGVEVSFAGPFGGRVILFVSRSVLPTVAGNMLGEDGEHLTDEVQMDALGELANVICGNVLPEIAGLQETFALTPPSRVRGQAIGEPACRVQVGLDEGRAEVRLYLDRPMEEDAEEAA